MNQMTARDLVVARLKGVYESWTRDTTLKQMRDDWDAFYTTDSEIQTELFDIDGLRSAWVNNRIRSSSSASAISAQTTLLYLHGGGFRMGSVRSHLNLMAQISEASGYRVLGIDYRLCPEHPYPAALEDTEAAYRWLLAQDIPAEQIALVGDSAGGNLVAALLNKLRLQGDTLPATAVLMSPWLDMTASHETYATRADCDPIHQRRFITALASGYLGEAADPQSPLTSPLQGDLNGFPPILIQVGDRDVVLGDSLDYAKKAKAAGVDLELEVWDGMIHVFQLFVEDLPEARQAIDSIGAFLRRHLS